MARTNSVAVIKVECVATFQVRYASPEDCRKRACVPTDLVAVRSDGVVVLDGRTEDGLRRKLQQLYQEHEAFDTTEALIVE